MIFYLPYVDRRSYIPPVQIGAVMVCISPCCVFYVLYVVVGGGGGIRGLA